MLPGAATTGGADRGTPMFASVSRCVASFGAGRCPCPRRRISSRFRADFRGFLRLCGGQEQGSRRSPAKRVLWEDATQRNERVFAAFGRNEGYGACADEKQDKNFKTGARAPVFLRDRLSGTVQIRTVGGSVFPPPARSVSPFHLTIPPKMRHNSPWKGCAHYTA